MRRWVFCCLLSSVTSQQIYNYYELAVQKWCSKEYMIHGLWPQIDADHYPTYCEDVEYVDPTGELLQSMNTYWKGCDDSLWEHEWEKHGSCIKKQNNMTEYEFFNQTLQLFQSYKGLTDKVCNTKNDNCIIGCFDLDYNFMNCENNIS